MLDFNQWCSLNEQLIYEQLIISNKKPIKPKLELFSRMDNNLIFLTQNNKIALSLTLDHNTAYSWNQLKNKKLKYSVNCIDVAKISYGVYGICHKYIPGVNFNKAFSQDFNRNSDYKVDPINWLEYQLGFITKLDEINRDTYLRKLNIYSTETGLFMRQIWENYIELSKNKLIINKIELKNIGYLNRYCMFNVNGQILIQNKMTEFILDPYPEVILQFGINPVFGGTSEVTKNLHRLSRLYYQYLLNTEKLKI